MKFIIKNRSDVKNAFFPGGTAILISITDPDKNHCLPSGRYRDVLCVKFDDADMDASGVLLITTEIAKNIIEFVVKNMDIDNVVVNCEGGISRSAGTAAALSKIFTGDDSELVRAKPFFNRLVYRTILDEWQEIVDNTRHEITKIIDDITKIHPICPNMRKMVEESEDNLVKYCGECPKCGKLLVDNTSWSGVKCPDEECGYWFCY